jgi:hypothetical protein
MRPKRAEFIFLGGDIDSEGCSNATKRATNYLPEQDRVSLIKWKCDQAGGAETILLEP